MRQPTLLAFLAFVLAAAPAAFAQNQPTTDFYPGPNSINTGFWGAPGMKSGAESQAAALNRPARIYGRGDFCTQVGDLTLRCTFKTLSACEGSGLQGNLSCVANPATATGSGFAR
jgi:hypothetical protein